jgi:hypothetical protein
MAYNQWIKIEKNESFVKRKSGGVTVENYKEALPELFL